MTASLSASVTAEEIIAFVGWQPTGVTSHQVGDHFGIGWHKAAHRLARLARNGELRRRFEARRPCGKIAVYTT